MFFIRGFKSSLARCLPFGRGGEITINGVDYRLGDTIATGAFSTIYRAVVIGHENNTTNPCIIKKIICRYEEDVTLVEKEIEMHTLFKGRKYILQLLGWTQKRIDEKRGKQPQTRAPDDDGDDVDNDGDDGDDYEDDNIPPPIIDDDDDDGSLSASNNSNNNNNNKNNKNQKPAKHKKKKRVPFTGTIEYYLLFPYYKNGSLQHRIETMDGYFSEEELLSLFSKICESVRILHSCSPAYAHRDIKPHNIMLDDDDAPVLIDFGSAAVGKVNLTTAKEALAFKDLAAKHCSLPYRAPELFEPTIDSCIDERLDVWSLGATLFAMAYYHSPFESPAMLKNGASIHLAAINAKITFPAHDVTRYAKIVNELITGMMKADPKERLPLDKVMSLIAEHLQKQPQQQS